MADSKISGLTAATAAAGTNELAINEAGASKKLTVAQLKAFMLGTATPLVESGAGAPGTSPNAAHDDHVHPGASATATPALTLGTTNAPGVATTSLQTDATILAFDATAPTTQAFSDAAAVGTAAVAARRDHKHAMMAAPAAERAASSTTPAAVGTAAVGTGMTDARADHVHATGAGTPTTQVAGDSAATGSGPAAAMTDHRHGMPAADPAGNAIVGGETLPRLAVFNQGAAAIATGTLSLGYFTALTAAPPCTKVVTYTGNAAAAATPSLCRVGLYTVAGNGDLALVASVPNTTSLWASTFTAYFTNLSANYTLVVGQRYALGLLIVTAGATPTFWGGNVPVASDLAPKLWGGVGSQTDLAASYTAAQVTWQAGSGLLWAAITP